MMRQLSIDPTSALDVVNAQYSSTTAIGDGAFTLRNLLDAHELPAIGADYFFEIADRLDEIIGDLGQLAADVAAADHLGLMSFGLVGGITATGDADLTERLNNTDGFAFRLTIITADPADLDAAVGSMTPAEQEAFVNKIEALPPMPLPFMDPVLGTDAIIVKLGESLSLNNYRALGAFTERIDPSPHDPNYRYRDLTGTPLFAGNGVPDPDQFNQGQLGNCYFVSAAIAAGEFDPTALGDMIEPNPNGTFTITFADGHREVVTPDVVHRIDQHGNEVVAYGNSDSGAMFLPLLEKAFAQRAAAQRPGQSGYSSIVGGSQEEALEVLTGRTGAHEARWRHTLDDLDTRMDQGEIIGLNTNETANMPAGQTLGDGTRMAEEHAYLVVDIDTTARTLTIVDPHDASAPPITMTEQEYEDFVRAVNWSTP